MRLSTIDWIKLDGAKVHFLWAPTVVKSGDKYYCYYAVGPQNPTPSRIGVAIASEPEGPYVDKGKPLITGGNGFEAIDPMVFHDASGKWYLYCGGSDGAKLKVYELKEDMTNVSREVQLTHLSIMLKVHLCIVVMDSIIYPTVLDIGMMLPIACVIRPHIRLWVRGLIKAKFLKVMRRTLDPDINVSSESQKQIHGISPTTDGICRKYRGARRNFAY